MRKAITSTWLACAVCSCLALTSCGIKFRDENVNLDLPNDYKYRTPIKNTADLRFHMIENVGLLITPGPEPGTYEVLSSPILPNNFTAREDIIKDGTVYSSKITQGASAKGSYLSFAASLSLDQAVDFSIIDVSRVDIPWNQFPDDKIRIAAEKPNPKGIKRLWIQSLLLSRVLSKSYAKLSCDASGAGPAFQTEGKCYNTTDLALPDYAIGVVFLDIDKYVQNNPSPSSTGSNLLYGLSTMINLPSTARGEDGTNELPPFISVEPPIREIKGIQK
jgi:hypothetical protein